MAEVKRQAKKVKNTIPAFKTKKDEAKFWETHSPLEYPDHFKDSDIHVSRSLRHKQIVSVRLDEETIQDMVRIARKKRIGLSTLARMLIAEGLDREHKAS